MSLVTPTAPRRRTLLQVGLASLVLLALNVAAYLALQSPAGQQVLDGMGQWSYLGAFLVMLVANATVIIPIPWPALLIPIAAAAPALWPVMLASALGSTIGESSAYVIGRAGSSIVEDTRFARWAARQMTQPWRAGVVLFVLSAPLNPVFDVAGLLAGAARVPFWIFFVAVLAGRLLRFAVLLQLGLLAGLG